MPNLKNIDCVLVIGCELKPTLKTRMLTLMMMLMLMRRMMMMMMVKLMTMVASSCPT